MILTCPAAAAQPAADAPGARWQCSAMGAGDVALPPAATLGGIVNHFAGLYSTRVLGLVQTRERVYLLGTGSFASKESLRAEVISAGPARHEYVAKRHVFHSEPERGRAGAGGFICLLEADAGRHGLARTERGDVELKAGKGVSLFDPSDPSVVVELAASERAPMQLREIAALSGRLGIYAGLMRQRRQVNANIAIQGPGGEIVFKAVPDPLLAGTTATASRGGVGLTVTDAVARKAATAAPPPKRTPQVSATAVEVREPAGEVVAPDDRRVIATPATATAPPVVPALSRGNEGSYEYALRKLHERQGAGRVRSVSALTQVHPAVDALRTLLGP